MEPTFRNLRVNKNLNSSIHHYCDTHKQWDNLLLRSLRSSYVDVNVVEKYEGVGIHGVPREVELSIQSHSV